MTAQLVRRDHWAVLGMSRNGKHLEGRPLQEGVIGFWNVSENRALAHEPLKICKGQAKTLVRGAAGLCYRKRVCVCVCV